MAWLFPAAEQQWAHSCCSASSLESAFQGPVTAIEADILMGTIESEHGEVPIMAHPPCRTSDLSFEDFWQRCLAEARHHLKLDFKDPGTQGWVGSVHPVCGMAPVKVLLRLFQML